MSTDIEERLRRDLGAGSLPAAPAADLVDEAVRRADHRAVRRRRLAIGAAGVLVVGLVAVLGVRFGRDGVEGPASPQDVPTATASTVEVPGSTVPTVVVPDVTASTIEVAGAAVSTIEVPDGSLATTVATPSPAPSSTALPALLEPSAAWQPLAANPLGVRDDAVAVWTGEEAITWGGTDRSGAAHADGAAYDPDSDTWRTIAPGELSPRVGEVAAWTGTEMLVIGGETDTGDMLLNQLAGYDPMTDRWVWKATPPFVSVTDEDVVAWVGDALVVWTVDGEAASYDPVTDSWTALPPTPIAARRDAAAAWTGTELVVWGGLSADGRTNLADGAALDTSTGRWRMLAAAPLSGRVTEAFWTGSVVVVRGGYAGSGTVEALADGAAYDPSTDSWTPIGAGPAHPGFVGVWTGTQLVEMAKGMAVLWNPATDHWIEPEELRGGPSGRQAPLWTGRYVLAFGSLADGTVGGGIALQPALVAG